MTTAYRIAIVGAASLRGKELNETLAESSFAGSEFLLMDDQAALGQLESVGDEVTFIQPITPDSFDRVDFAFFASHPDVTRRHWRSALGAGASVIDLSYALENEPGVLVRGPWLRAGEKSPEAAGQRRVSPSWPAHRSQSSAAPLDLHTFAVVPAHPAALAIALLAERLSQAGAIHGISATILEPASEYGRAAMDELHQQTVALLSFEAVPKSIYDIQVAFNAITVAGEGAKINLEEAESRIHRHYELLSTGRLPSLSLQLVHPAVFHGHDYSMAVEFEEPAAIEQVESALAGDHIEIVSTDMDAPSNLTSAGQDEILVRLRSGEEGRSPSRHFWIWASTDNLKVAASNAVACAEEMRRLRPRGQVQ